MFSGFIDLKYNPDVRIHLFVSLFTEGFSASYVIQSRIS